MKTEAITSRFTKIFVIFVATIASISLARAESYLDFNTTITEVYINQQGWPLMKIADQTNSPEGFLVIPGGLHTPGSKAMYAMALTAQVTQKNCWIRVIPTDTGYWVVDIINIR